MIARRKGYRITLVMPDNVTVERRQLAELFGAEIIDSPGAEGSNGAIALAKRLVAEDPRYVMPYQYGNPANPQAHYETTGPEILADCPEVDVFVAGLGTSGTLMGTGTLPARAQAGRPDRGGGATPGRAHGRACGRSTTASCPRSSTRPCSTRSTSSPTGTPWRRSGTWLPGKGVFAGPSSGAVLVAAAREAQRMDAGTIVALLPDGGWKYLSAGTFDRPSTRWRTPSRAG